jgi:hypothetical protein
VSLTIKNLLIWTLLINSELLAGQCASGPYAFQTGERLTYEVAYNWGVIWVDAGEVIFKVDTISKEDRTMFYFDSYGESYKFYDWFYKVRDRYQCVVQSKGFKPVWFTRKTSEGGYSVNNSYVYDWKKMQVVSSTENSKKSRSVDTLDLKPCSFDVLSAIYYARTFDFSTYEPGEKIPIRFLIDGQFYDLYIRYLGRENKKNRNGKVYDCNKFSAMLVDGTIFSGGEDMVVWVTADENKIPVMVEAKIIIGSIKAYLTGYENILTELKVVE